MLSRCTNLPPTEDAFEQHVLRAMYQTGIWCRSQIPKPILWNPVGKGWTLKDGTSLKPVMFRKEPAPISTAMIRTAVKVKSASVCLWDCTAQNIAPVITWTVPIPVIDSPHEEQLGQ